MSVCSTAVTPMCQQDHAARRPSSLSDTLRVCPATNKAAPLVTPKSEWHRHLIPDRFRKCRLDGPGHPPAMVRPPRRRGSAGDVLTGTELPGKTWEKEGRRGGKLLFSENVIEYRDQNGELVVTARGVGVRTEKVVEQGSGNG